MTTDKNLEQSWKHEKRDTNGAGVKVFAARVKNKPTPNIKEKFAN